METQEIEEKSTVISDLKLRTLGKGIACVDKEACNGNSYPKLVVNLEKLDVAKILEVQEKNKYPKVVRPDSENIVTSSNNNNNNNAKDCLQVRHLPDTMLTKQEKNDGNVTSSSGISLTTQIKQERLSDSTTKDPKTIPEIKIPKTPQLDSSNQSKVHKPAPAPQKTTSKARSEANLNFSSSKTSKPSREESDNYIPFDGAAFLHTQMGTNIALQSILKDIVTLNEEYHHTNDHLLEVEIEKLRARNKLPSLRTLHPFSNIEDSESPEDSFPESDDEIGNLGKDSGFDNESQESESNSETKKMAIRIVEDNKTSRIPVIPNLNTEEDLEDSKDSERLIIDELNTEQASSESKDSDSERLIINEPDDVSEDEPDYVDVEGIGLEKRKNTEVMSVNGNLVEIDNDALECPFCAKEFETINSLKQHLQPCLDSKLSKRSDSETVENNHSNGDAASSIKIGRVFSLGKEIIECDSGGDSESRKFRRTCVECGITFSRKSCLESHFQTTGHSRVYPHMSCAFCNFVAFNPSELGRHITFYHHTATILNKKLKHKKLSNYTDTVS